ncbi:hypothetical protein ND861_03340 [Leptospira sp. 2 VSF19]|uniref:DUF8198 domain-containing protein n=1 Tax=Leptospira soteropolitanensis TaxID=2950025 RepID=A0AAW5VKW6_9LEPT|nr:hypothetical protein [Leptospira soteropolitanensis]MCW7491679.1 hypothetical protein [Leptospira soteropolitanensis]MCW7499263.1 hypothetical protein [Leptospira soteropolitanensis]MCW7521145.1 hypothetical protein [Leptospira soteropolitanensis]MCW7525367.1 hypothetical protein [Leptospira soteropolitanensis]MCW7529234.1 hypothetical protein [Leptospira soteropolitanensis]
MKHQLTKEVSLARREIVRVQVDRFHLFYYDFFHRSETIEMAKFFFETVYNLDGKEEWESLAFSTYEKVKNMMKEGTKESVERLIELNSITDELDIQMAELLLSKGWELGKEISQEQYFALFCELDRKETRKKQLEIVLFNLKKFYELAHKPVSAYIIKPAAMMARLLGVYPLFKKVEQGYYATLPVRQDLFNEFYAKVQEKEWDFLHKAFPTLKEEI